MARSRFHLPVLRTFVLISIFLSFFLTTAQGQIATVDDTTSTPIQGAGHDYIHLLSETVNPANGSVSLRIQLPTPKGRGITLPFSIGYDSNSVNHLVPGYYPNYGTVNWAPNVGNLAQGGWSYGIPGAGAITWDATEGNYPNYFDCVIDSDYVFRDPAGGLHSLGLGFSQSANGNCQESPITGGGDAQFTASLTGYGLLTMFSPDGTVYHFPSVGISNGTTQAFSLPDYVEDRNGNQIISTSSGTGSSYSFAFTDTNGRSAISSNGFGPAGAANTISISGVTYQITWKTTSANFAIPSPNWVGQTGGPNQYDQCTSIPAVNDSQTVVSQITLPNGQSYKFYYGTDNPDPNFRNPYGLLSEIDYPTGGWVKYQWKLSDQWNELADYPGLINAGAFTCSTDPSAYCPAPVQDGCLYQYQAPAVAMREVGFGGSSTPSLTQVFSYGTAWDPNTPTIWDTKSTQMTSTDNVTVKVTFTAYAYTPIPQAPQPYSHTQIVSQIPVESSVARYDTNPLTLLRTENKAWIDQFLLGCEVDTLDNGMSSGTWYLYNSAAQLTNKKEFDYGLVSASSCAGVNPPAPSVTPTQETVTNYQPFPANPIGGTIYDRPSAVQIFGNGTLAAETDYTYGGGVTSVSASRHDETYFGPSFSAPRGNPASVTKKCLQNCGSPTTTYTYDETGQITSSTDPNRNRTQYSYSDPNNTNAYLTEVTYPPTNGIGHLENFSYDYAGGQLTTSTDQNGKNTIYQYSDPLVRPTQVNYPDGGQTNIAYSDAAPSPSVTTCQLINGASGAQCSATTPPPGWKTGVAVMDGIGHVVQTQLASDPEGADETDTSYDGIGRVLAVSNPYRQGRIYETEGTTTYAYDALGRVTSVTEPDGTPPMQGGGCPLSDICTTYSGNTTTVTDGAGNQRKSQTDALGRLTTVWEAPNVSGFNFETDYQYNALDDLLCAVQKGTDTTPFTSCASAPATWRPRTFTYDSLSRLLAASNPESGAITYAYDANGNLTSKVAPRPDAQSGTATTNFSYDALNRMTAKNFVGISTAAQQFGYDGIAPTGCKFAPPTITPPATFLIGRRSAMCDGWGVDTSWSYDSMGRVLTIARKLTGPAVAKNIGYTYNLDGSLLSLIYPSGNIVNYNVGGAGRTISVTDSSNNYVMPANKCVECSTVKDSGVRPFAVAIQGEYFPFGGLLAINLGSTATSSGIFEGNEDTNRLRPGYFRVQGPNQNLIERGYYYGYINGNFLGDNGDVTAIENSLDGNRTQNFTYDPLNRITQAYTNGPNWGEIFSTDAWGNMWNRAGVTGKTLYEPLNAPPNVHNHLTGFTYDAAGNLIRNGSTSYDYDAENHLYLVGGSPNWLYTYDNDGQRVRKAAGSTGTVYWRDSDGDTLAETDLTGNGKEEYIFFNGQRIARRDLPSGTVHYYFSDDIGSTSMVTNATGSVVEEDLDYYPYGGIVAGSLDSVPQNYKFTGKERDAESGLDNFGARYFTSNIGRFMTPDWAVRPTTVPYAVFGDPQSLNLYGYVRNDPVSRADADGHISPEAACPPDASCNPFEKEGQAKRDKIQPAQNQNPKSPGARAGDWWARVHKNWDRFWAKIDCNGPCPFGPSLAEMGVYIPPTKTLFRAVDLTEFKNIEKTGKFSPSPGGVEYKYFYPTIEQAQTMGERLYPGNYGIVSGTFPESAIEGPTPVGTEGDVFVVPNQNLEMAEPQMETPIPEVPE